MRQSTLAGLVALASSLAIVVTASAQPAPSTVPDAERTSTGPVASSRTTVKVIDRGSKPRQKLRYDWAVGQKEAVEIDLLMAGGMSMGISSGDDSQVPTMRVTMTNEITEAFSDGTLLLEQVVHAAGVPLEESDSILAAEQMGTRLSTMVGLTVRMRVDARGIVTESETIMPLGLTPGEVEGLPGDSLGVGVALVPLPRERVGPGAVWRVSQGVRNEQGFDVQTIQRVKLLRRDGDGLHLQMRLRQTAPKQRLEVPDMPDDFEMRLDSHLATGSGSADLDLGALAHVSELRLKSHTEMTASIGPQVETLMMDLTIETETRPMLIEDVPDQRIQDESVTRVERHEVTDEDFAVSFPSRWRVEPTTPDEHAWMYPEEPSDEPSYYGILFAVGEGQKCQVQNSTKWAKSWPGFDDVDELVNFELERFRRDPDTETAEGRFFDMPAGRVGRVETKRFDGLTEVWYWYTNGRRWLELDCWSYGPPDDLWTSIAKTFEFLDPAQFPAPTAPSPSSDLASAFPVAVRGRTLDVTSWTGQDWLDRYDPEDAADAAAIAATQALAENLSDVEIATTLIEPRPDNYATIAAVRVPGTESVAFLDPVIALMAGSTKPETSWRKRVDRSVMVVRDGAMPGSYPVIVYPSGDTIWVVQADQPLVDSILEGLPPQLPIRGPAQSLTRTEIPVVGVAVSFPDDWLIGEPSGGKNPFPALFHTGWLGSDVSTREVLHASGTVSDGRAVIDRCTLVLFSPVTLTPIEFLDKVWGNADYPTVEVLTDQIGRVRIEPGRDLSGQVGRDLLRFQEVYAFDAGDAIGLLWCASLDPPGELWRSVADSFEVTSHQVAAGRPPAPSPR